MYPPEFRIASRYEVAGNPLFGGMGLVYLCYDHQEQRPVALKTFRPEFLPDRAARDRFLREGDTWVRLGRHPHVVRCYGVEYVGDGREVYLVLELVAKDTTQERRDASLRSWLRPGQPLPLETTLLFALQIARGMLHATEVLPGFVHRDLKPENLLVGADKMHGSDVNRLRVTDFGLASVLADLESGLNVSEGDPQASHPSQTQLTHGIVGTPLYMAPEQWRGGPLTPAADIYAFGCILYEMLSGRFAVEPEHTEQVMEAHLAGTIAPLPSDLLEPVRALVNNCLVLDAEERPGSWADVLQLVADTFAQEMGLPVPIPADTVELTREDRLAAGWAKNSLGVSYLDIGKAEVAADYFEQVRAAGDAEGESVLMSAGLGGLGSAYFQLGDARRAIDYHEQALAISRKIGDRHGEGRNLGNLGSAYLHLGDARRAIEYFEQALAIFREMGDRHSEGRNLGNLGLAYRQLGDAQRAIDYFEQALVISRKIGDRRGEGSALGNLGPTYLRLGDARRAIFYGEQALAIQKEMGNRYGEGVDLGGLGNAYGQLGDVRRAIDYYEQVLAIHREIGDRHGEGAALGNLGNAYFQLGDARRAIEYFEQALAIYREIGDRRGESSVLDNLGIAYRQLGQVRQAIDYHEKALAFRREIGDRFGVASGALNLAATFARQGETTKARPLAEEAAALFRQMGNFQYTQQAERLATSLREPGSKGPALEITEVLKAFDPLINAAVSVSQGNKTIQSQIESSFATLSANGWQIVEPIKRIWSGERDEAALTQGIDPNSAAIVREILRRL